MTTPEPEESRALGALTELLRDGAAKPTEPELARGLFRLRARMVQGDSRPQRWARWAALSAVLLVCLAFVVVIRRPFGGQPSAPMPAVAVAKIEGGKLIEGGYLSESGHAGVALVFNEGSEFRLTPGSRGRLRAVGSDGVRFALEHGTASFQITQNPNRKWSVEAGPFLVSVKGTEFSVTWDPQSERFDVKLRRGRIVVSGPVLGEDLALRAGQNLTVNLPAAETIITEGRLETATEEAGERIRSGAPVPSATNAAPASGKPAASAAPSATVAGERRWNQALADGRWDRILADVERDGVDATLQAASSEELVALADAARYRRRADLARAALLAQRRRFPGSPRALDALFLLGRVEELRANGSAAISWYDQYLARGPGGTYAAEALGRKMILSNELGGPALARPLAAEYLRRFPRGSYAGAARALERGP